MRLFNTYAVRSSSVESENETLRTVCLSHNLTDKEQEDVSLLSEGESLTVTGLIILCVGHKNER